MSLMTTLPRKSKSMGNKRRSPVMTLKPCADDHTYYRVRLLAFNPTKASGSNRDYPFIQRFVHQHWSKNPEKGYPVLDDEITCPVTPYVEVEGNRYDACKICTLANKYFLTFKESGWKDKDANRKNKEFGRKFQYIVPVYCVSNPNWEGDSGKFRVIIFNDKKFADEFRKKVERASQTMNVFNGQNAVDLCIHVAEKLEVVNEGQPNERTFKKREIDKLVFSTKPYDIPVINNETVEAGADGPMGFDFDDEFYTTSTPEEIDEFYRKYCTVSNDDIPDGDDIPAYAAAPAKPAPAPAVDLSNDIPDEPLGDVGSVDDLTTDPDDLPPPAKPAAKPPAKLAAKVEDVDAEALVAELGI